MSYDTDESEAVELVTFADNTYALYRRKQQFEIAAAKKMAAGTYDHEQAKKLWLYFADEAAAAFDEDANLKRKGTGSKAFIAPAVRKLAAKMFADEFRDEVALGNFDDLIASVMTKKRKKELGLA